MREFDAIVIGVGGMGSSAVYHLAKRGWRVLGLERYDIPNEMGSSHGVSRMIRLAYHEDPSYVPLLYRAYELWHQLENRSGEKLLVTTGCVRGGVGANKLLEGSLETVRQHHLPYRLLSGPEINREWPGYQLPEDAEMLYEQQGGFVLSERCIVAHVAGALGLGAEVHGREAALDWEPTSAGGVVVTTDRDTYSARRLVVTAGAWAGKVAPEIADQNEPPLTEASHVQTEPAIYPSGSVSVACTGSPTRGGDGSRTTVPGSSVPSVAIFTNKVSLVRPMRSKGSE